MRIMLIGLAVVVVAGVAFVGTAKVGAWAQVGREELVEQVEHAIGEFRVRQVEVRQGMAGLEASIRRIQEGRIKSEVQAEQLGQRQAQIQERKAASQSSLRQLRDLIAAGQPAVLAGKQYSVDQLGTLAERLIAGFRSLETQASGMERARQLLLENARILSARARQAQESVAAMTTRMEEIDAKLMALETMREAAEAAGGDPESLAASFRAVQDQIQDLYTQVEIGLRTEELAWQDSGLPGEAEVQQIIQETQDTQETLRRIDEILKD